MNPWTYICTKVLPALIACTTDLFTKSKIRDKDYENHPVRILGGRVTITRWFNHGAMLGILKGHERILKIVMSTGLGALLYMLFIRDSYSSVTDVGLSMALGGAAGNTYERMRYGRVTDFIRFNRGPERFKRINFNVGDFAVFAGVIMMCIGEIFNNK